MAPVDMQNQTKPMQSDVKTGAAPTTPSRPAAPHTAPSASYGATVAMEERRPGWVTFAAVMTFIAAFWYGLISLMEFANSTWFITVSGHTYSLFSSHLFWWAMFDAGIAILAIAAAVSLLRGGFFGLTMGLLGAAVSMLRWMFFIPAAPWLALTIILLDILVVVGLCLSFDWFDQANA